MTGQIPAVVIPRLPVYARALARLAEAGIETVSSQELGNQLQVTPAQIRKDLSYFGKFGKQGKGYNVRHLLGQLKQILGLDREWRMALVGVGRLGRAIVEYGGFAPEGFRVMAAFDSDPKIVGTKVGDLIIHHISQLGQTIPRLNIDIGIVAVPANQAQEVVDTLVKAGVKAILNYAPIAVQVPKEVKVKEIDPVVALQGMTYYLKNPPGS